MVRRWSCVNQEISTAFYVKFETKKITKALSFRNYNTNCTRFKRKKLGKWRRFNNSALEVQIIKFWIRDYLFTKKTARWVSSEFIFSLSFFVQDGLSIKKKTPLAVRQFFFFNQSSAAASTFKYFYKKAAACRCASSFSFKGEYAYLNNSISTPDQRFFGDSTQLVDIGEMIKPYNTIQNDYIEQNAGSDIFLSLIFNKVDIDSYSLECTQDGFSIEPPYVIFLNEICRNYIIVTYRIFAYLLFLNVK